MSKKEEIWTKRNGVLMLKSRATQLDKKEKKPVKEKTPDKLDKKGGK